MRSWNETESTEITVLRGSRQRLEYGRSPHSDRSVRRTHAWRDRAALARRGVPADMTVGRPSLGQWSATTERCTSPTRICNSHGGCRLFANI